MNNEKKKLNLKIIITIVVAIVIIIGGVAGVIIYLNSPSYKYEQASKLEQAEQFEEALALYKEIEEYNNSKEKIKLLARKILHLDDIVKLMENKVLYYNGGNDTTLCQITFTEQEATILKVKFDGNGQQKLSTDTYNWDLDTEKIIVNDDLNINYKVENESISFEEGKYFDTEQVIDGIQGYWKLRKLNYIQLLKQFSTTENNIYIHGDKITAQNASTSAYSSTEYFYTGPEEKSYSLNIGEIKAPNDDGTISGNFMGYSFNIIDGQVKVLYYDKVMERTDSLPDVNKYKF